MFVFVENHVSFLRGYFHGKDFILEVAGGDGALGPLLASQAEAVLLFAGQVIAFDEVFRRDAHDQLVFRIGRGFASQNLRRRERIGRVGARQHPGRLAPAFHAAGDVNVAQTRHNLCGGEVDGLQARRTLALHGHAGDAVGQARLEDGPARRIVGRMPGVGKPHHHILDQIGVDAGLVHQPPDGKGAQFLRAKACNGPARASDSRPDAFDNDDFLHDEFSFLIKRSVKNRFDIPLSCGSLGKQKSVMSVRQ